MNELLLYGTVGSSWWDEEFFTAKTVRESLADMTGPLTVRINSGGGIATEGQAIYTALRGYSGEVHIVVEGIAASAASLIAMAGSSITMSTGAIMMIHDPASWYVSAISTLGTVWRDCVAEALRLIFIPVGVEDDEEPKDRASETH
ncbi:ATP-dependent Clp protease proteolytic subunit, partial [Pseudogemmobacter faecipullorum]